MNQKSQENRLLISARNGRRTRSGWFSTPPGVGTKNDFRERMRSLRTTTQERHQLLKAATWESGRSWNLLVGGRAQVGTIRPGIRVCHRAPNGGQFLAGGA